MHHSQKPSYMVQRLYVWTGQSALVGLGLFTISVRFWSNPLHFLWPCAADLHLFEAFEILCITSHKQPHSVSLIQCFTFTNTGTRFKIDFYKLYPKSCLNKVLKDIQRDCISLKMYLGCTYRGCFCLEMTGCFDIRTSKPFTKLSFFHSNFYQQSCQTFFTVVISVTCLSQKHILKSPRCTSQWHHWIVHSPSSFSRRLPFETGSSTA